MRVAFSPRDRASTASLGDLREPQATRRGGLTPGRLSPTARTAAVLIDERCLGVGDGGSVARWSTDELPQVLRVPGGHPAR